ncbi:MAG: DUF2290 domain-containing protein, partial [Bacteroidetes bacterium]|nr:DUF2290 domain-containing protein [Bacteroidota bacterium]
MSSPIEIVNEINSIISHLTRNDLVDDQNFAYFTSRRGTTQILFRGSEYLSGALKKRDYFELYRLMTTRRVYNIKMLDGGLIQMNYEFVETSLKRHRLAFYPSPTLDEFSTNPEIYFDDEIDGDIVVTNTNPFFLRFDYDTRSNSSQKFSHPKSHLSLGHYPHCRIPVTAPMTPLWFIDFIMKNFYETPYFSYTDLHPKKKCSFGESIFWFYHDICGYRSKPPQKKR